MKEDPLGQTWAGYAGFIDPNDYDLNMFQFE